MFFRISFVALTVSIPLALSCVAAPYEPDEISAGYESAVPEPQVGEKTGASPLYRWTSFVLVERHEPEGPLWVWTPGAAWWINAYRPSVMLDRGPANRGIFMGFYDGIHGVDPQMPGRAVSLDYRVPVDNLVTSTRFELIGAEGRVYASGGDDVVCDGQPNVTTVIDAPNVLVALRYSCVPVVDHGKPDWDEDICALCELLESPAAECDGWMFGPSL